MQNDVLSSQQVEMAIDFFNTHKEECVEELKNIKLENIID